MNLLSPQQPYYSKAHFWFFSDSVRPYYSKGGDGEAEIKDLLPDNLHWFIPALYNSRGNLKDHPSFLMHLPIRGERRACSHNTIHLPITCT